MRIMKKAKFDKELVQVLCPYGEWKHSRGMQVVDFESARRMKRSMLILRALGGIPIYIGHPDDYPDGEKVPVGKIVGIFSTHDGIAVVARYSDSVCGRILKKEISAMSPRWQMEKLPDGKYRPVRLLSVGLTNNPNIPLSGTIISAVPDGKESFAKGCAKKMETLACCVERGAVGIRAAGKPVFARKSKKTAMEICELARERSMRTGEPYTKCFAVLKRTIS